MSPRAGMQDAVGPCRVLVVDDQADLRDLLRLYLELNGYEVVTAADGAEALEKALAIRPDVALVDLGLPRIDGFAVARRLRQEFGEGIKLIALTGYGQPRDRQQALAAGFDLHRTKPLDLDELPRLLPGRRRGFSVDGVAFRPRAVTPPTRPPQPVPEPPTEPAPPPDPGLPPEEPPAPRPGGPVPREGQAAGAAD